MRRAPPKHRGLELVKALLHAPEQEALGERQVVTSRSGVGMDRRIRSGGAFSGSRRLDDGLVAFASALFAAENPGHLRLRDSEALGEVDLSSTVRVSALEA